MDRYCLSIVGCGKLGTAVLSGILASVGDSPNLALSKIHVTVRSPSSVERVRKAIASHHALESSGLSEQLVSVHLQAANEFAVEEADIVVLGCKPTAYGSILQDPAVRDALMRGTKRRILVSMLGGVSIAELDRCLDDSLRARCTIIRAIPNIAARIRESMTVISRNSGAGALTEDETTVGQLFARVGPILYAHESQLNVTSTLAASATAYYAKMIQAAAQGSSGIELPVALSLEDALFISAHACRGASGLVIAGQSPDSIVEEVATPGGSTMAGLKVMKSGGFSSTVEQAIVECAEATAKLSAVRKTAETATKA